MLVLYHPAIAKRFLFYIHIFYLIFCVARRHLSITVTQEILLLGRMEYIAKCIIRKMKKRKRKREEKKLKNFIK